MSTKSQLQPQDQQLDNSYPRRDFPTIQNYLDASGDAARRVRNMVLALVVASVLTLIALLNSMQNSWMLKRMQLLRNTDNDYLAQYIGPSPKLDNYHKSWHQRFIQDYVAYQAQAAGGPNQQSSPNVAWYDEQAVEEYRHDIGAYNLRYQAFVTAGFRALIDTRFLVHLPFFGSTFDVNDLGSLSGLGLTILLILVRLNVGAELENVKLAFREARKRGLQNTGFYVGFYQLLAMKQVLTTPQLPDRDTHWFHKYIPGLVSFVPALVYGLVVSNDIYTNGIGFELNLIRTLLLLGADIFCVIIIVALSIISYRKFIEVDKRWTEAWCDYMSDEFSQTKDGEWLRRLYHAVERKQFTALQLIGSLPRPDRINSGKVVEYESMDRWILTIDLDANSVSIKPGDASEALSAAQS